jgi:acyl dehydratase
MSTAQIGWQVGDELEERRLPPVSRLDLIKYAGASGDYNPIHTIDDEATKAGLPGIIQHGMLTMARIGTLFSPYLEHGFVRDFGIRYSGMVFLGDELVIRGKVTGVEDAGDGQVYTLEVSAATTEGRTVAKGSAELVVPR